jgi:hypothetical protein
MASGAAVRKTEGGAVEAPKSGEGTRRYSAEFLAEQEVIERRVREEGARRIRASVEKLIAMGIVDKDGKRIKKEFPADMQPGADRDFGG